MDDLTKVIKQLESGGYSKTMKFGKRKHSVSKRRQKICQKRMLEDAGVKGVDW